MMEPPALPSDDMPPGETPDRDGEPGGPPDGDAALMVQAAAGNDGAFAVLVEKHQRALLNFFLRSGAQEEGEDLVQETFVRLFRYRDRYRPVARFSTFLYHLARHVWIDRTRKMGRDQRLQRAWREEQSAQGGAAPPGLEPGAAGDVARALAGLSPKLRDVVVLGIYQGLRYQEVAEVLGIPEGTVKSRMSLAMAALKKSLHDPKTLPPS